MSSNYIKCLACPVAHHFISEYSNFYSYYRNKFKSKKPDESFNTLNSILSTLGAEQSSVEDMRSIKFDTEIKRTIETNHECCFNNIRSIVTLTKELMYSSEEYFISLEQIGKQGVKVIAEIEQLLKENEIKSGAEPLTEEEKAWSEKFCEHFENDHEKAEDIYLKLSDIFLTYTDNVNRIEYKRCSRIHADTPICSDINFDDLKDCFAQPAYSTDYSNESLIPYSKLTIRNIEILQTYLKKAPKKFSYIFNQILNRFDKEERLSASDISYLLYGDNAHRSIYSNYKNGKESERTQETKEPLKKLARVLLVSEEVLSCGIGKIYGTWKSAISENTNYLFQYGDNHTKGLLSQEEIDEFNSKEKSRSHRISDPTKEKIYQNIKKLISQTDDDFYAMIREYSDNEDESKNFFRIENFNAFFYEEGGELFFDYQAMYDQLLEPKSFDVLLSVLLELQETHETEDNEPDSISPQEWLDIVSKHNN